MHVCIHVQSESVESNPIPYCGSDGGNFFRSNPNTCLTFAFHSVSYDVKLFKRSHQCLLHAPQKSVYITLSCVQIQDWVSYELTGTVVSPLASSFNPNYGDAVYLCWNFVRNCFANSEGMRMLNHNQRIWNLISSSKTDKPVLQI